MIKKIVPQKEIIITLEKEINNLNRALYNLKEVHASLVDERYSTYNTLIEKVVKE